MAIVYLALGSNVGDSGRHIEQAIGLLQERVSGLVRAPMYRSRATGYTEQPDFWNTVVGGQTDLSPHELLEFVKGLEEQVGRVRRFRWGPREIDIDIILYGQAILDEPELMIPHLRLAEREFVLQPLYDLAPELVEPRSGRRVRELLADLPDTQRSIVR